MKNNNDNRKKKLLALCLSAITFASVGALASCKDNTTDSSSSSSSSSSSTAEVKDDGLIKNAGFETYDEDNAINTSVTGWSRSTDSTTNGTALSSKAASGIIDLGEEGWKDLTGSYYSNPDKAKSLTVEEAKADWDKLTTRDKLAFYDAWKEANSGKTISSELDFYETLNIDTGDIPTFNRGDVNTHDDAVADDTKDSKILMIHNQYPDESLKTVGTAQKFTSSSTVTVKAGQMAKFSVWVKTLDLKCATTDGGSQDAVGKGAYISITHSVGGKSLDEYKVENINTQLMADSELSNGWKQYTFLLNGSSYADTTFSLVLGLGQGGSGMRAEYVNGYAFFDDIKCETVDSTNATFSQALTDNGIDVNDVVSFEHEGEQKVVNAYKETKDAFAMDYYGQEFVAETNLLNDVEIKATTSKVSGQEVSSLAGQNPAFWLEGGFDGSNDKNTVYNDLAAMKAEAEAEGANKYLKNVYENYFKDDTVSGKILLMLSAKGAAYTAQPQMEDPDNAGQKIPYSFKVAGEGYKAISFLVKTSEMGSYTGAGITLVDGNNKTSFTSIDTTTVEDTDGWQRVFFFVKNEAETEAEFSLYFTFGPTAIDSTTGRDKYREGFVAFNDFKVYNDMSEEAYECAQSGTYAKLVSIAAEEEELKGDGFDSAMGIPENNLETGLADSKNYKGVYADSAYITGKGSTEINTLVNAGLVNKTEFLKYYDTKTAGEAWFDGIKAKGYATAEDAWNGVFSKDATQPLLIWNDATSANKSYGFIGKSTAIAANTYTAISLRVKGTTGAKASVYLVDMDKNSYGDLQENYNELLSIGRNITYWYDGNGNICSEDPDKSSHYVAFRLQTNGLYKANKAYKPVYDKLTNKDGYFANLSAYTEKDEQGNLLVAKNGATHEYNDYWNNEGVDGIAFYHKDGKYYADSACTVLVEDLATVEGLAKRYEAESADNYELKEEITVKEDAWTTITFYIHTGDEAKNYRLEVWSGTRDNVNSDNAEGRYLAFDYDNPGAAETNFTKLVEQYAKDEYKDNVKSFESVFSYFDTDNYLRYNAELDENKVGNLYEDNYTPSANTEGVAYLRYANGTANKYVVFADYQYTEKTVAKAEVEEDTEEEDTTTDDGNETNVWLLISSLSIAGVLLLAIVSIIVQKIIKNKRKNVEPAPKKDKKSKK